MPDALPCATFLHEVLPPHARNASQHPRRHVHRQPELRHLRPCNSVGGPHAGPARLRRMFELRRGVRGRRGRRACSVRQDPRRISLDSEIRPPSVGVDRGDCPQGRAREAAAAGHHASVRARTGAATCRHAAEHCRQADVTTDHSGGRAVTRLDATRRTARAIFGRAGRLRLSAQVLRTSFPASGAGRAGR